MEITIDKLTYHNLWQLYFTDEHQSLTFLLTEEELNKLRFLVGAELDKIELKGGD